MANNVRLFGAVVAVSIGALAFKGVDIAQAVAQAAKEAAPPPPETQLTAGVGARPSDDPAPGPNGAPPAEAAAKTGGAKGDSCSPGIDGAAEEMGLSAQDIAVLRSLQQRRKELDDRETAVDTREQAATAAEGRLQEQIAQLKTVEGRVNALLTQINAQADKRMQDLVKTYEGMKPAQAATIFNSMDDAVLIDIAKTMKPATLGPILAAMTPKRAEQVTRMLADLSKPPAGLDNLPKSPT